MRQREDETTPVPGLALDPDVAAVQLDEALRERQTEPRALSLLRPGVGLLELLEDPVLVGERYPRSRVGHRHPHLPVDPRGRDRDLAARRRELDGVREEVEDDLADAPL